MIKIHITNATLEIVDDQQYQKNLITELEASLKKATIYIDTLEKLFVKNEKLEKKDELNFPGIHPELLKPELPINSIKGITTSKKCTDCGKDYQPTGNAQVRCAECKGKKKKLPGINHVGIVLQKITRKCSNCKHQSLCKISLKCKPGTVHFWEPKENRVTDPETLDNTITA